MKNGYNPKVVTAFLAEFGIPEPFFEYKFSPARKWRFDMAWPRIFYPNIIIRGYGEMPSLAIEVQGGIWTRGRHTRGAAMLKEWEKLNEAAALGWRILYVQPNELCRSETAKLIKRALYL